MKAMYDLSQLKIIGNKQVLDKQLKHSVNTLAKQMLSLNTCLVFFNS